MTDVRVRYLSGDEAIFPNMLTTRHVQVAVASKQDHFAPDVLLFTDDGVQLADAANVPPPEKIVAITRIADGENTRRWIDVLRIHAFANDETGVVRALDILAKSDRTREDITSLCTVSFIDMLFDDVRPEREVGGLEILLRSKADCNNNSYMCGHQSPLLAAVKKGNHGIVKELVKVCKEKLQLNKPTIGICTRPLGEACAHGYEDIVGTLILAHADVNTRDAFGMTPLHAAATYGHSDICTALLEANAVLDSKDHSHRSALSCACSSGHASTVTRLISAGANPTNTCPSTGATPIMDALTHNHPGVAHIFLTHDMLVELRGKIVAADVTGSTPLHIAAANGHWSLLASFVEAGCAINARDYSGRTALYRAAWNGHAEAATRLLACNADVHVTDHFRWSPLHAAATSGHASVLMELLSLGLNVDMVDEVHCTALYLAAKAGRTQCVRALVNAAANLESMDNQGCTALYRATWAGHEDCVRVLLANGAKTNIRCRPTGSTPLHGAAWHAHCGLVRMLLQYKADAHAADNNGVTPLDEANEQEVTLLLISAK